MTDIPRRGTMGDKPWLNLRYFGFHEIGAASRQRPAPRQQEDWS